jgi:putative oxidoreductase
MRLARLVFRVILGALFIGHGTQKLFGWFGGHGPEGTGEFFEKVGLKPGKEQAVAAGAAEAASGALIALGLLTPVGSALVIGVMAGAIRTAHAGKGPWVTEGGWEYPLVVGAAAMALAEAGPGPLSLDAALDIERCGTAWALAALAAGVGGSYLVMSVGEQVAATAEPQPQPQPESVTA